MNGLELENEKDKEANLGSKEMTKESSRRKVHQKSQR